MLSANRQIICHVCIFGHGANQSFFLMVTDTNHKKSVVFQPLLNKIVILSLILELTVYSFESVLLNRVGQRDWNGKYNQILR